MKSSINKALFLAVIAAQTEKLASVLKGEKDRPLTKEEQRIKDTYDALSCGGSQSDYRRKIEAQYAEDGKKLNPAVWDEEERGVTYKPIQGAAFIHTGNSNGHNYRIGAVCVFDAGYHDDPKLDLTTTDVGWHNHASSYVKDVRPATRTEIEKLWPYAEKIVGTEFGDAFSKPLTKKNLAAIVDYL
jgi:hypothetical protein